VLTICDALAAAEGDGRPAAFFVLPNGDETWSRRELHLRTVEHAAALRAAGLEPGDRLALAIWEPRDFVPAMLGAIWAGIVPIPLAPPIGAGREGSFAVWATVAAAGRPTALLTTDAAAAVLPAEAVPPSCRVITTSALIPGHVELVRPRPADPVFLQFTSGSTATPRGVVVTHGSLAANSEAIMRRGLAVDPSRDIGVSWLPMWHDMGLIGCVLAAVTHGLPVAYLPTTSYVRDPLSWLRTITRYRATVTFAPCSAYAAVNRRAARAGTHGLDLSSMRAFGCGAEPIDATVLAAFVDAFGGCGLRPETLLPCYGLAEATLAVTFADPERGFQAEEVDAGRLESDRVAEAVTADDGPSGPVRRVVSCGRPLGDTRVDIVDPDGRPLGERRVGEVVVSGPSVAGGYLDDPGATAATFRPGGLRTGDLGYLADGELYLTGRAKDLLVLGGRNVDPHAVEWALHGLLDVRAGHCAAFSRPGPYGEEVVVVAETRSWPSVDETIDEPGIMAAVRRVVHEQLAVAVADVVLVAPGTLPRTTSGKLRRAEVRRRYLAAQPVPAQPGRVDQVPAAG
jgi:fatty-acyl-CoA synthase